MISKYSAIDMGWDMLQKHLDIEPPQPISLHLGCKHGVGTAKLPDGPLVVTLVYNMQAFFESCVQRHVELTGGTAKLRGVAAPPFDRRKRYEARTDPRASWCWSRRGVSFLRPCVPSRCGGQAWHPIIVPPGRIELHRRATSEAKRAQKSAEEPSRDYKGEMASDALAMLLKSLVLMDTPVLPTMTSVVLIMGSPSLMGQRAPTVNRSVWMVNTLAWMDTAAPTMMKHTPHISHIEVRIHAFEASFENSLWAQSDVAAHLTLIDERIVAARGQLAIAGVCMQNRSKILEDGVACIAARLEDWELQAARLDLRFGTLIRESVAASMTF